MKPTPLLLIGLTELPSSTQLRKAFERSLTLSLGLALAFSCLNATAATTVVVTAQNFSFNPSAVTIAVGDSVSFNNVGGNHNVTGYNPAPPPERFCGTTVVGSGPMCLVTFTNTGVFQYRCVPHSSGSGTSFSGMVGSITVTPPPGPPLVVITNPVNNSLFASLAAVTMRARVTVTGPAVTNLQFFANEALVGLDTTSPFSVNASNLAAGDYSLTARARDTRGMNGTSAPVNIRVIDRPLLLAQSGADGLQFSFNTVTGLNYVVQASIGQLTNWSGLVTNRATTTNQAYIEASDVGPLRFYRVIVQP